MSIQAFIADHGPTGFRRGTVLGCVLLTLFCLAGCATSSELERLDASLSQRLDTVSAGIRADQSRIQAQLEAQGKRQQDLSRVLEALKTSMEAEGKAVRRDLVDSKAVFEELLGSIVAQAQLSKDTRLQLDRTQKALEEFSGKMHRELASLEEAAKAASTRLEQLPSMVSQVGNQVHGLSQMVTGSFKMEEAALRERLKAVEHLLKQLEPVPVKTTQAAPSK
jgi:hypothetical protein